MGTAVRLILASYPMWWKERYGAETADLTEDLLADDDARYLGVLFNLAVGSVLAWVHYRRPDRRPRFVGTQWGPVPDGGHRDIFGNRGLSDRSIQELDPDESVLGVIDGIQGSQLLATGPPVFVIMIVTWLLLDLFMQHVGPRSEFTTLLPPVVMLVISLVARRVTSSAVVAIAVTSNGLAVFRMRTYSRRSDRLVRRLPAAPPTVVRTGATRIKVDLGGPAFWVESRSLPLIRWMGGWGAAATGPTSPA